MWEEALFFLGNIPSPPFFSPFPSFPLLLLFHLFLSTNILFNLAFDILLLHGVRATSAFKCNLSQTEKKEREKEDKMKGE